MSTPDAPRRRRVARLWHRIFDERPGDPLPMEAIGLALILSLGSAVGGSLAAGMDFWINVLASFALLGPGLLITNVVARNWRDRRALDRTNTQLMPIFEDLCRFAWDYAIRPTDALLMECGLEAVGERPTKGKEEQPPKTLLRNTMMAIFRVQMACKDAARRDDLQDSENAIFLMVEYETFMALTKALVVRLEQEQQVHMPEAKMRLEDLEKQVQRVGEKAFAQRGIGLPADNRPDPMEAKREVVDAAGMACSSIFGVFASMMDRLPNV